MTKKIITDIDTKLNEVIKSIENRLKYYKEIEEKYKFSLNKINELESHLENKITVYKQADQCIKPRCFSFCKSFKSFF